jgi:hypothetical protein
MSQATIETGTADNDETGDALKTALGKINANFTELYAADAVRLRFKTGSKTFDWGSIADGAMASTTVTLTGVDRGNTALATMSVAIPAGAILSAQVTDVDTVTVTLFNKTGAALDLASGTLRVDVFYP